MESTGISDTGATNICYSPDAPLLKLDTSATRVHVGTANGHMDRSSATAEAATPQLAHDFPTTGYIMNYFKHTLVDIGPIYDAGRQVTFSAQYVTVFSPNGRAIITGWREADGAKLWRFSLTPHDNQLSPTKLDTQEVMLSGFSACDLPVMEVLVHYLHATDGFPVKSMWLYTIKSGNYATWPGTTFYNADKYLT